MFMGACVHQLEALRAPLRPLRACQSQNLHQEWINLERPEMVRKMTATFKVVLLLPLRPTGNWPRLFPS